MTQPSELYTSLSSQLVQYCRRVEAQSSKSILSFPSSEIDNFGQTLFSNLKKGGFCTLVVPGHTSWDPNSYYFQLARVASSRGCSIKRLFLLPHKQNRHDKCLKAHIKLDEEAGIDTKMLFVGDLISSLTLPHTESLDFGIWDNEICCSAVYGSGGPYFGIIEWKVSKRPEDIQLFSNLLSEIQSNALFIEPDYGSTNLDLEEPMINTAPIVYELAPVLCCGDHVSANDCSWYHSIWQYLRIFDMVSTPTWHTDFYSNIYSKFAREGLKNVLISGTADYSLLAHVLWAYQTNLTDLKVTVLDLCETPLFLCKWFAKLFQHPIDTYAADLLKYTPKTNVDLITTDAFLTRFSPSERIKIVKKWYDLLESKGKIVTTVRIETGMKESYVGSTLSQITAFKKRAELAARKWKGFLAHSVDDIANGAQIYAENMKSYSIGSKEELLQLFVDVGFSVDHCELVTVRGEMKSTEYAEVVLSK
jgi:hypothetical protein